MTVFSAKENLFLANAKKRKGFNVRIGASRYDVNVPHYVHHEDHYIPVGDLERVLKPVVDSLSYRPFLQEGSLLSNALPSDDEALVQAIEVYDECDYTSIEGVNHSRFLGYSDDDSFRGFLPVAELLARIADHLQDGKPSTEEERDFWIPVIRDMVENDLGSADVCMFTTRSCQHPYKALGDKIQFPAQSLDI